MFSLWIIHHKVHYKLIVDTWLDILRNSKPKHRLTLLYLANDVIQSCRRKKADVFKEYFATILPEAISSLRDKAISSGVERVLNIWSSRKVYDIDFIDQLHAALLTNRTPDTLRQKLLAEYKPTALIDQIEDFKKNEDLVSVDEKQLRSIHMEASSSENIHKLKDKVGGEIFSKNFEESATNIERFIVKYEDLVKKRKALIEELNQGAVFYRAQYQEAKIVVNAYQNFDGRVGKMKKMLDQVKLKFSPVASPTEAGYSQDGNVADMDMSDSDQELGSKPSKIVAVDTAHRQAPVKATVVASITPSQPSATFVNRPGMRGASTSSIFSSPMKTSSNLIIPTISNGTVTPGFNSKVSTPSASPPSPEGSPELNISSPPRYPSLESRLADIFSIEPKPGASSTTENTASESEEETVSNSTKQSPLQKEEQVDENVNKGFGMTSAVQPEAKNNQSESWQNTIPVIGGNRRSSKQPGDFMENIGMLHDGGSTPLQDEANSDNDSFQKKLLSGLKPLESVLPPPSFSGDALTFLTKFMGQQTSTSLSQSETQTPPTVTQPTSATHTDVLQNLNIDWASLQNLTASVGKWPTAPSTSSYISASSTQNGNTLMTQVSSEQDTDYRTAGNTDRNQVTSTSSSSQAADEYRVISRQISSEAVPNFPTSTDDFVVEEEEILVEEDGRGDFNTNVQRLHPVHLNNLKNIPSANDDVMSPPPRPPSHNIHELTGHKRSFESGHGPAGPSNYLNHEPMGREMEHASRFPPRPRFDGHRGRLATMPHGPRFNSRPRPRNVVMESTMAEDRYYDMLYDELRPKYPRPGGRGRFMSRRPFR